MSSSYCGTRSRRLLGAPLNTPFAEISQVQVCHSLLLCYLSYSNFYCPVNAVSILFLELLCHSSSYTAMALGCSTEKLKAKLLLE